MAARLHPSPPSPELIDLRRLSARDLEPLLEEETAAWREELDWDFEKSADLVRRFVDLRALNGSAIVEDNAVAGYMYYVLEENKGLIGDLYVRREYRTVSARIASSAWRSMPSLASPTGEVLRTGYYSSGRRHKTLTDAQKIWSGSSFLAGFGSQLYLGFFSSAQLCREHQRWWPWRRSSSCGLSFRRR